MDLQIKIEYDTPCWHCGEDALQVLDPAFLENGVCVICEGTKYQLTDAGKELLKFLKRHSV
jgi:hypothetical protein